MFPNLIASSFNQRECSICIDEILLPTDSIKSKCGHLFHESCITHWLDVRNSNEEPLTCPNCRSITIPFDREIPKEFESNLYVESKILLAVRSGRKDTLERLLKDNPNSVNSLYNSAISRSKTSLLYIAAQEGHLETVHALLDQGAEIDLRLDKGSTALHIAVQEGHLETVRALLDQGADINLTVDNRSTALHIAAHNGNVEILKTLLIKGADPNARNLNGSTSLNIAKEMEHMDIIEVLQPLKKINPFMNAILKFF